MEVINKVNLDYVLNLSRACDCVCSTCSPKDIHPVLNCELECKSKEGLVKKIK